MPLATFNAWKVKIPGVSIEMVSSDEAQFTSALTSSDTNLVGYYLMAIFEMKNSAGTFTTRERGMYGIHYVNATSGALDTTWTTADYTAVESAHTTFWGAIPGLFAPDVRLVEFRWYPFGPGFHGTKSSPVPPSRVLQIGSPPTGTTGGAMIRQVGSTVTLRTALRRHWGRFYLPVTSSQFATQGQMSTGNVDALAAAARTMLTAPEASQGVSPVVWDRTRKQALGVTAIEADSVPDIVRRRRPRDPAYKKIYTV
jgi:hypothetical protein